MDKFALKQCFFDVDKPKEKQSAGFIADKLGLANEISLVETALGEGVPALLADLTTTIRHGDVCSMTDADPELVEVKTSKNVDTRGRRQKRRLEKLRSFRETDQATRLRGFPDVRRQVFDTPERTHVADLNACIAEAIDKGHAVKSPEPGLHYVATTNRGPELPEVLRSLALKEPWVFPLNEYKVERAWAPYMPFTLTIENKDHLWDIVRGDLYLLVVLETGALCDSARNHAYEAKFDRDNKDCPLHINIPDADEWPRVSSQFLTRIALECVSPDWAVQTSIEMMKKGIELRP